jgi:signal transduction histidine kinase
MEERFAESGIAVVSDLESAPARFSRDGIRMAVRNLLENAVKYSDRGGSVSVALRHEGGRAVLSVADAGVGFPPGEAASLFERFYRSASREAESRGGAGLGLYLVKEIAAAHGGTVSCRSAGVGKGSVFSVHLPVPARPPLAAGARPAPVRPGLLGRGAS